MMTDTLLVLHSEENKTHFSGNISCLNLLCVISILINIT